MRSKRVRSNVITFISSAPEQTNKMSCSISKSPSAASWASKRLVISLTSHHLKPYEVHVNNFELGNNDFKYR